MKVQISMKTKNQARKITGEVKIILYCRLWMSDGQESRESREAEFRIPGHLSLFLAEFRAENVVNDWNFKQNWKYTTCIRSLFPQ